tara:strand:- start:91 stop:708 length:618 start_codon:yes stop_codon:yes gene_type:complete
LKEIILEKSPDKIESLIALIAKLPGLGPRSARRAVLRMIKKQDTIMKPLATMIQEVSNTAKECITCGNISDQEICNICISETRSTREICVVEDVSDLWAMERTNVFRGKYHVLGGTLSALDSVGPEELGIPKLVKRVISENISEVILALNSTMDGQTTAHYIADQLGKHPITVSSLAQGVPIGGELDYLDDGTISAALIARRSLD